MSEQDFNVVDQKSQTEFRPTYLYVKTHNVTGLKYFGKTIKKDVHKYKGSGVRWLNHIRVHGYDVTTEILGYFENSNECNMFALEFSKVNDIVRSNCWANLVEEVGTDGSGKGMIVTDNFREKMRLINKERIKNGTHQFFRNGISNSKMRVENGTHHFLGGAIQTERVKNGTHHLLGGEIQRNAALSKMDTFNFSKFFTDCNLKMLKDGTHPSQLKRVCEYCHCEVNLSNYIRWHGDNCKMKPNSQFDF